MKFLNDDLNLEELMLLKNMVTEVREDLLRPESKKQSPRLSLELSIADQNRLLEISHKISTALREKMRFPTEKRHG